MKRKCPICKADKIIDGYSEYCKKCGLFLGEIDKEKIIKNIDSMILMWNMWKSPKKFDYYTKMSDGHIRFEYRGVKKIIDYITFGDDLNFDQFTSLVQIISYLTIEFDYNITSLAIILFAFATQFFDNAKIPFKYWLRVGLKEKNSVAYDYLLALMYSVEKDKTKRGRRQIAKIKAILRHLPNYQI